MLKVLAIIFGVIVMITRGYGALYPTKVKELVTKMASSPGIMRVWGAVLLVFGVLTFFGLNNNVSGARVVMLILAILLVFGGFFLILWSRRYAVLVDWFMHLPDSTLRTLYGIGFAFGLLLVVVGAYCY